MFLYHFVDSDLRVEILKKERQQKKGALILKQRIEVSVHTYTGG